MYFTAFILLALISTVSSASSANSGSIKWYDYEEGILTAHSSNKHVMIDFYADWCPPCKAMEENTYPDPAVVAEAESYVSIKVTNMKNHEIETKYGVEYFPTVVFLDPNGEEITRHIGYLNAEDLSGLMKKVKMDTETAKDIKRAPGAGVFLSMLVLIFVFAVIKSKI